MRRHTSNITAVFIFTFLQIISAQTIIIPNSGFEQFRHEEPIQWMVEKPENVDVGPDGIIKSSGSSSICVTHESPGITRILSDSLILKVGRLYRLSAKIKTENAFTDPNKQYPTPVAACVTMRSFPFTNSSPSVGATTDWRKVEVYFFAVTKYDHIILNFGYNGVVTGKVWFDEVELEETDDITKIFPTETIKRYGKAFRYEDKGWINLHIEGKPYERGIQYGYLAANEIKEFINKLSCAKQKDNPSAAWGIIRSVCDMLFYRKYDEEYLLEMKGIAEGVNRAGVQIFGRPADVLDIVSINSDVDLEYAGDAVKKTATPLTGKSFLSSEDELDIKERLHKCSGMLATKSATKDHRMLFGQLFMWGGYTGPHWNFMVDVVPENGHRLVYETFPGGIHSGADFYLNSAGIIIGETTVGQTPFNINGTPQSNRIRKAAQYASSIDDVVKILTTDNNGLYTNDWLIADSKTDEIAILLLGTEKYKLWRSNSGEFYGGQKDWYWSNNNTKDLEVRKEYRVNDDNAPVDLTFRPWDRDVAFYNFYEKNKGQIDAAACINLWNSSPVNRPHACDGKVTNSEMAEKMMFFANYGKVTLRETFVNENGRIPDLPGAIPRLSLGYTVINPVFAADKIKLLNDSLALKSAPELSNDFSDVCSIYSYDKKGLWSNTVYPSGDDVNWFISATSAYWNTLNNISGSVAKSFNTVREDLAELNSRYLYTLSREGSVIPVETKTVYNQYKNYQIPRIRGTYALHQLRLLLGDDAFSRSMQAIHTQFKEKNITNTDIVNVFEINAGTSAKDFLGQWITRDELPEIKYTCNYIPINSGCRAAIIFHQSGKPFHLITTCAFELEGERIYKKVELKKQTDTAFFTFDKKPRNFIFNAGNDIPLKQERFYTFSNLYDDFSKAIIVYGTNSEIEANHTLALRFSRTAADRFTETLLPVKKESELTDDELKNNDLIIIGSPKVNSLTRKVCEEAKISAYNNYFIWNGKLYNNPDDGLFCAVPNPYNPNKAAYLFISNSSLQLYQILKTMQRMPAYAVFKGEQITWKGNRTN